MRLKCLVSLLAFLVVFQAEVFAETGAYRLDFENLSYLRSTENFSFAGLRADPCQGVRFDRLIPGYGRYTFELGGVRHENVLPGRSFVGFHGVAWGKFGEYPAVGSLMSIDGRVEFSVVTNIPNEENGEIHRLVLEVPDVPESDRASIAGTISEGSGGLTGDTCATALDANPDSILSPASATPRGIFFEPATISLFIHVDRKWMKRHYRNGDFAILHALQVVNEAEVYLLAGINMAIRVLIVDVETPLRIEGTGITPMLFNYKSYVIERPYYGGSNVYYLFSGKRFPGNNDVAQSWIGNLCGGQYDRQNMGVLLYDGKNRNQLGTALAHELMHNLNAYDVTDKGKLMHNAWIGTPPWKISKQTRRSVRNQLDFLNINDNNCFTPGHEKPIPPLPAKKVQCAKQSAQPVTFVNQSNVRVGLILQDRSSGRNYELGRLRRGKKRTIPLGLGRYKILFVSVPTDEIVKKRFRVVYFKRFCNKDREIVLNTIFD